MSLVKKSLLYIKKKHVVYIFLSFENRGLQTETYAFANSVDPDETVKNRLIKINAVCHSVTDFCLRLLSGTMVLSNFKDGRVHFRH